MSVFETLATAPVAHVTAAPARGTGSAEYTCPMHPQVRQSDPGTCPLCGMSLEPVVAAVRAEASPELQDMTRRFWIALVLSVPVFLLEMGSHLFDLHRLISPQASNWVQGALATPVVFWAGWPFFVRAWASVVNRSLNMFSLVALGTGVAWTYSVIGTPPTSHTFRPALTCARSGEGRPRRASMRQLGMSEVYGFEEDS